MLSPGPSGRGVLPFAGWEAGSSLSGLWAWLLWRCSSLRTDPEAQLPARGLARRVSPAPPPPDCIGGRGIPDAGWGRQHRSPISAAHVKSADFRHLSIKQAVLGAPALETLRREALLPKGGVGGGRTGGWLAELRAGHPGRPPRNREVPGCMPVLGWAVFLHNLLAPTQPPGPHPRCSPLSWSQAQPLLPARAARREGLTT